MFDYNINMYIIYDKLNFMAIFNLGDTEKVESFFNSIASELENKKWGSIYLTIMNEFYKGKWDGKTFWKSDSISLDDDFLYSGFVEAITEIVPTYDLYGETEISIEEWREIGKVILTKDSASQEVYNEATTIDIIEINIDMLESPIKSV